MSLSDFSLSSPRKGSRKSVDKSLTYDEDFENFLNETSESEFSQKKLIKQAKPWWMNDDDDQKGSKGKSTTKSFMKQTKPQTPPTKLTTTYEEDKEDSDKKENSNKYSDDFDEQVPKLSIDNHSSLSNYNLDNKEKRSFDRYDDDIKYDDFEEESSEQISSSRKSQQSVIFRKSEDKSFDKDLKVNPASNEPGATNLLSKVMFMDSLESGGVGNQTIKQALVSANYFDNANRTKNSEEKKSNVNNTQINESHLNTQTRRDLADLAMVYRNLTTYTDSGLNTLIKAGTDSGRNHEDEDEKEDEEQESDRNQINAVSLISSKHFANESDIDLQAINVIKNELENRVLEEVLREMNKNDKKPHFERGQNFNNKRKEVIKEAQNSSLEWPPNKYKHIKGTGYGTTWLPKPSQSAASQKDLEASISLRSATRIITNAHSYMNSRNYTPRNETSMFQANEYRNQEIINDLQDQLIKCVEENDHKLKDMRFDYENQLNDLRSKIVQMTTQLNEKNSETFKKKVSFETGDSKDDDKKKSDDYIKKLEEKIQLLEKSLSEQERLMKGYQTENERLYTEMKKLRENTTKQVSKIEDEKKQLKLNLIQERFLIEKETKNKKVVSEQPRQPVPEKIPETKIILPIVQESSTDQELETKIKDLEEKNKDFLNKLIYYEKNQQQIELDVKIIDEKNKQIKSLNEKMKSLELGKSPPECLREIKRLKNQIKEMELVVKRLRRPGKNSSNPEAINLSLDYYEKRIQNLEDQLKEKSLDLERQSRMWQQKFYLFKQVKDEEAKMGFRSASKSPTRSKSPINYDFLDKKLIDIENKYLDKIKNLENLNSNLRKLLEEFEIRVDERDKEIEILKNKENYLIELDKKVNNNKQLAVNFAKKSYEPNEFMDKFLEREETSSGFPKFDSEYVKNLLSEVESVKVKLANAQNEIKLREKDHELKFEQIKNAYEKRLGDLNRKHKYEVEKLISVLTGSFDDTKSLSFITNNEYDSESVLDDPIRLRLLIEARDKNKTNQAKFEKLVEINRNLNDKLNILNSYKTRYEGLEELNRRLKERLVEIESDLDKAKQNYTPQMRDFEILNDKLKLIEKKYAQREKELSDLLSGKTSSLSILNSSNSAQSNFENVSIKTENEAQINEIVNYYELQLKIKNKEIEKFKNELDNMLKLLQSLQN